MKFSDSLTETDSRLRQPVNGAAFCRTSAAPTLNSLADSRSGRTRRVDPSSSMDARAVLRTGSYRRTVLAQRQFELKSYTELLNDAI